MQLMLTLFAVAAVGGVAYAIRISGDTARVAQQKNESPTSAITPSATSATAPSQQETAAAPEQSPAAVINFTTETDAQELAQGGRDVVYFFSASWCPDCQRINRSLDDAEQLSKLKPGTTIVRVDYDTYTSLKQKYAVTYQTTFVRIDGTGKQIKKATLSSYSALERF
jgi:thioredoxin 1